MQKVNANLVFVSSPSLLRIFDVLTILPSEPRDSLARHTGRPVPNHLQVQRTVARVGKHKFAWNACGKALAMADATERHNLIDEISSPKQEGASAIIIMMKGQLRVSLYMHHPLARFIVIDVFGLRLRSSAHPPCRWR